MKTETQLTAVEWLVDQMRQRKEQGLTLSFYDLEMFAEKAKAMSEDERHKAYLYGHEVGFMKAKEMEEKQMIDFALFRDDYLEKAEKLDDFTIPNEKLIKLLKHETFKSE